MSKFKIFAASIAAASLIASCAPEDRAGQDGAKKFPEGMVWIEGGTFLQGAVQPGEYEREYPQHPVEVKGFFIDTTEVTNDQFAAFVEATGYVTVAEQPINWDDIAAQLPPGTPKIADSLLVPGSLVFSPADNITSLDNHFQWWAWSIGADWKHPEGPGSNIDLRGNHPVVHVAYTDALAYCEWKGGRLPTEAEWEYAARGGLEAKRFTWGEEDPIANPALANIFQGTFPSENEALDGYSGTSPVGVFPANGYGLYDIAGNVWEWCSDKFSEDYYYTIDAKQACRNPVGPARSFDSRDPYSQKRVIKGGSYLCHVSYCENYRPSARESESEDTGMPHIGFRCVRDM